MPDRPAPSPVAAAPLPKAELRRAELPRANGRGASVGAPPRGLLLAGAVVAVVVLVWLARRSRG
jgi:hypothetical protein